MYGLTSAAVLVHLYMLNVEHLDCKKIVMMMVYVQACAALAGIDG